MGGYRGGLSGIRPDDLAAHVIAAAVERTGLDPARVDDVYMGAANQSGEDNRDVARMGALLAGLPVDVPGVTVNRLCASGLEAVNQASRALRLGEGSLYLAGGVESMSRAPWVLPKPETGLPRGEQTLYDTTLGWRMINPRMSERYSTESMGETGENVADATASRARSRIASRCRATSAAIAAQRGGPLRRSDRADRGAAQEPSRRADDHDRRRGTARRTPRWRSSRSSGLPSARAARSPPAIPPRSTTGPPAWSSPTRRPRRSSAREPLARIVSIGVAGVDPAYMGIGPMVAIPKALERAGLELDQIDLIELNEAFASQVLACAEGLGIDEERLNVNGGRDRARPSARLLRGPPDDEPGLGAAAPQGALRDRDALRRRRPGRAPSRSWRPCSSDSLDSRVLTSVNGQITRYRLRP